MKEQLYEQHLKKCASKICNDLHLRWVLIAGGSCSGKTTTTKKLSERIREGGRKVECISLDDYYRNPENAVYLPNGKMDVESLQSLRVDLLQETLSSLSHLGRAEIPMFDFQKHRRFDAYRTVTLSENTVVLIEGLHALNPAILPEDVNASCLYRMYLYADSEDGTDSRFLRRLVRDHRYRDADASYTCAQWDAVLAAEKETIEPFIPLADEKINTYFDYERQILADDAIAVLSELPATDAHWQTVQPLIEKLKTVELLPDDVIPKGSLLWEFI